MKIIRTDTDKGLWGLKIFVETEDRKAYVISTKRKGENADEIKKATALTVGDEFILEEFPSARNMMEL